LHKINDTLWLIKKYDVETKKITTVCNALQGSEDYCWMSDGKLLMGKGGMLYLLNPQTSNSWKELTDLNIFGIKNFNRIAISPDGKKIAVVVPE